MSSFRIFWIRGVFRVLWGLVMYVLLAFTYHVPVQQYWFFRTHIRQRRLHGFSTDVNCKLNRATVVHQNLVYQYSLRVAMSTWLGAHNLEPTLWMSNLFWFRDTIWRKPIIYYLQDKKKRTGSKVMYFPNVLMTWFCIVFVLLFLETDTGNQLVTVW